MANDWGESTDLELNSALEHKNIHDVLVCEQ